MTPQPQVNWELLDKEIAKIQKKFRMRHAQLAKRNLPGDEAARAQMELIDAENAEVTAFRKGFLRGIHGSI